MQEQLRQKNRDNCLRPLMQSNPFLLMKAHVLSYVEMRCSINMLIVNTYEIISFLSYSGLRLFTFLLPTENKYTDYYENLLF